MPKVTAEQALQLIENERGLIRVLVSNAGDDQHLNFLLDQLIDPEHCRPVRPLVPGADPNYIFDHEQKEFVLRPQPYARGAAQPGVDTIEPLATTLVPADGRMRLYNHALVNQEQKTIAFAFDAGSDPDRYRNQPDVDTSQEPCIVHLSFTQDAGTANEWWIKGQPLNDYHRENGYNEAKGLYPKPVSFSELRAYNKAFSKNLSAYGRHNKERTEVLVAPRARSLFAVIALKDALTDRVNALYAKLLVWERLRVDVPVIVMDENGKRLYPELNQARDILEAFAQGDPFAEQILGRLSLPSAPLDGVFADFYKMFIHYAAYVEQSGIIYTEAMMKDFYLYYERVQLESPVLQITTPTTEEKTPSLERYIQKHPYVAKTIKSKMLWSDIVSLTHQHNEKLIQAKSVELSILTRLEKSGITGDHQAIYKKMVTYLQENTKIVLAFEAAKLMSAMPQGLYSFNKIEKDGVCERFVLESETFAFIPDIKVQFSEFPGARPHYAFLVLNNAENIPLFLTTDYGYSYFVLRDVVKLNSVFVPHNIARTGSVATPCTYLNFAILLEQAKDDLFLGIVNAVTGQLPEEQISGQLGYEMHAYLPPIPLFDSHVVERLYISPDEHKLTVAEKEFIEKRGIKVCNEGDHAYGPEIAEMNEAALAQDTARFEAIMQRYPFLRITAEQALQQGRYVMYRFLAQKEQGGLPTHNWQALFSKVEPVNFESFMKEFMTVLLEKNDSLALSEWIAAIFYLTHCSEHEKARVLLEHKPELLHLVEEVTQRSLLHCAVAAENPEAEFVKYLCQSRYAHTNDSKNESSLFIAMQQFYLLQESKESPRFSDYCEQESYMDSMLLHMLEHVPYTKAQLHLVFLMREGFVSKKVMRKLSQLILDKAETAEEAYACLLSACKARSVEALEPFQRSMESKEDGQDVSSSVPSDVVLRFIQNMPDLKQDSALTQAALSVGNYETLYMLCEQGFVMDEACWASLPMRYRAGKREPELAWLIATRPNLTLQTWKNYAEKSIRALSPLESYPYLSFDDMDQLKVSKIRYHAVDASFQDCTSRLFKLLDLFIFDYDDLEEAGVCVEIHKDTREEIDLILGNKVEEIDKVKQALLANNLLPVLLNRIHGDQAEWCESHSSLVNLLEQAPQEMKSEEMNDSLLDALELPLNDDGSGGLEAIKRRLDQCVTGLCVEARDHSSMMTMHFSDQKVYALVSALLKCQHLLFRLELLANIGAMNLQINCNYALLVVCSNYNLGGGHSESYYTYARFFQRQSQHQAQLTQNTSVDSSNDNPASLATFNNSP